MTVDQLRELLVYFTAKNVDLPRQLLSRKLRRVSVDLDKEDKEEAGFFPAKNLGETAAKFHNIVNRLGSELLHQLRPNMLVADPSTLVVAAQRQLLRVLSHKGLDAKILETNQLDIDSLSLDKKTLHRLEMFLRCLKGCLMMREQWRADYGDLCFLASFQNMVGGIEADKATVGWSW
jgi:hypothetical protein